MFSTNHIFESRYFPKSWWLNLGNNELNKIIKDVRDISFPMALFNSELDLKSISASLKALSIKEIETGFRSLRENHPPRHDFNSFSFKNITHLDKKLDTEFFYELGRAGYF